MKRKDDSNVAGGVVQKRFNVHRIHQPLMVCRQWARTIRIRSHSMQWVIRSRCDDLTIATQSHLSFEQFSNPCSIMTTNLVAVGEKVSSASHFDGITLEHCTNGKLIVSRTIHWVFGFRLLWIRNNVEAFSSAANG